MNAIQKQLRLAMSAGALLLKNGAETYRVEETVRYILSQTDHDEINVLAVMTGISASIIDKDGNIYSEIQRIENRQIHLGNIEKINQISREIVAKSISTDEAWKQLSIIEHPQPNTNTPFQQKLKTSLTTIFICSSFALMLGGTLSDCIGAFIAGLILVGLKPFNRIAEPNPMIRASIQSFVVTLGMILLRQFFLNNLSLSISIAAGLMLLFPGTAITSSIRDIMHGDYLSGAGRGLEAFIIAFAIGLGVAIGLYLGGAYL